jgi:hypothetical protein
MIGAGEAMGGAHRAPTDGHAPRGEAVRGRRGSCRPPLDVFGVDRHSHLAKKVTVE